MPRRNSPADSEPSGAALEHGRAEILLPQDLERRRLGAGVGLDRLGCGHEPFRIRVGEEVATCSMQRRERPRRVGLCVDSTQCHTLSPWNCSFAASSRSYQRARSSRVLQASPFPRPCARGAQGGHSIPRRGRPQLIELCVDSTRCHKLSPWNRSFPGVLARMGCEVLLLCHKVLGSRVMALDSGEPWEGGSLTESE